MPKIKVVNLSTKVCIIPPTSATIRAAMQQFQLKVWHFDFQLQLLLLQLMLAKMHHPIHFFFLFTKLDLWFFWNITSDGGTPLTSLLLPLLRVWLPTSNSGLLLLLLLALHGCCSYLSKLSAWSSRQFRVTLPSHARVESNLLWWKDKETLIEISPSGHLALSFHMGLDKLFSSRLAVHAVFDPSFATTNETKTALTSFDSTWSCGAAELDVGERSILQF